jgi:hypothetical protein
MGYFKIKVIESVPIPCFLSPRYFCFFQCFLPYFTLSFYSSHRNESAEFSHSKWWKSYSWSLQRHWHFKWWLLKTIFFLETFLTVETGQVTLKVALSQSDLRVFKLLQINALLLNTDQDNDDHILSIPTLFPQPYSRGISKKRACPTF